jgi:CO dehydrogenase/acetyl-CoA synthase beta subunit
MELFNSHISQVQDFLDRKRKENKLVESIHQGVCDWPRTKNKTLVLGQDTAVELGNPKTAATSCLLWTNDETSIQNRRISILGPDLSDLKEPQAPFGKIVLIAGEGFNEENSYERYRALEKVRYNVFLTGYMMRGAVQFQREWSRVSMEALNKGFSLKTLGSALMDQYFELDFVRSVEIVFITSGNEDVLAMNDVTTNAMNIIGAMNKMTKEMSLDCDTCEYVEVCGEVASLRNMRRRREQEGTTYA